MRRVSCDQNEFNPPDSEQSLDLAIASPSRECPDLEALLTICGASAVSGSPPLAGWVRWPQVGDHLLRFAGLELPLPGRLGATVLIRDVWNEVELGVECGSVLVWYRWATSA